MFFPQPFLFTPVGVPVTPAPPWQEILDLATAGGWQSVYDMNNPETWTLRDAGGGSMFYTSVADGLGNRDPLVQATTANQPSQVLQGDHYVAQFDGSTDVLARSAGTITSPRTITTVVRIGSTANFRNFIGDNSLNFFAQSSTYAFLISDGSTNLTTSDGVFTSNTYAVVTGIWDSGSNNTKVRVNGSQVYQGTLTPPTMTGLRVGYAFPGQIGLVATYQGTLGGGDAALTDLEALLMEQYGIS